MPSSTALQRRKQMKQTENQLNHTLWQRVERGVFLLGVVVLVLDLYWWRP
jgi:hypothetical protein